TAPHRAHHALGTYLVQCRVPLGQRGLRLVGLLRIVDQRDVDPVEPQSLQALFEAAPYPGAGEVPLPAQGRRYVEAVVQVARALPGGVGHDQSADLGGQRVLLARTRPQYRTHPPLGQAETVVRGGVEVPDAALPGRLDGRGRILVRYHLVQIADRRGTEAQLADLDPGAPDSLHDGSSHTWWIPMSPPE